ncbi:MAG: hypothetical protein KA319_10885 [Ferruginibacter sp.]|nr:hypothetical protein [Ferruginibacter sp.]
MNKKLILGFTLAFTIKNAAGQFYYKDIITNVQSSTELNILKTEKVKEVGVTSLEQDGIPSEGFFCKKEISKNYTKVQVITQTATSYKSFFTSIYSKEGLLISSNDSSEVSVTNTNYTYDNNNNIISINSSTLLLDEESQDKIFEDHYYSYNEKNIPTNLAVVKNKKDSVNYLFTTDENGNIALEKNTLTGDIYYYYYDSKNRLTEIVHKYQNQKKSTTDYIFQYNRNNQITQMKAAEQEGAYYFTWKYIYEGNLRTTELCYSKEGKLVGSIEYKYR